MLEEILKKPSLNEEDLKIIRANRHLLSDETLIRLGMKEPAPVDNPVDKVPEETPEPEKPKKRTIKK